MLIQKKKKKIKWLIKLEKKELERHYNSAYAKPDVDLFHNQLLSPIVYKPKKMRDIFRC